MQQRGQGDQDQPDYGQSNPYEPIRRRSDGVRPQRGAQQPQWAQEPTDAGQQPGQPGWQTPPTAQKPKKKNTALGCGCLSLVAIVVIVFIVVAVNTGNSAPSGSPAGTTTIAPATTATTATTAASPAQTLADLDGDTSPVAAYQAALDALAPKCTQDEAHIAGLGDAGYQDLVKNGITDETRLTVLQHLSESIPASLGKTDCTGVLSAYLVLREGG